MLGLNKISITTLLLCFALVSAAATRTPEPASEMHLVVHDTRSDMYHVYRRDGSVYGRYDQENFEREVEYEMLNARGSGACQALTLDQAKTLPGWGKIEQYAIDHYGDGGWNILVNPPEYPGSAATVCVDNAVVQVEMRGSPSCVDNDGQIEGQLDGTDGTVKLGYQQGFTNEATWSVTQSSELAVSLSFTATIGVPEVASVSTTASTTATFSNEVGSSFTTSINNIQTQEVVFDSKEGKHCTATFKTSTCNVGGEGKVRMVADGWVWFNYNDKRAPKDDPNGGDHYKYAVNIASAVQNIDERSSFLNFVGSMKATSKSNYHATCV